MKEFNRIDRDIMKARAEILDILDKYDLVMYAEESRGVSEIKFSKFIP